LHLAPQGFNLSAKPPDAPFADADMLLWLYDLPTPVMAAVFIVFFLAVRLLGLLLLRPFIGRITGVDADLNGETS